jgi:Ca-activated chloride channel family protein
MLEHFHFIRPLWLLALIPLALLGWHVYRPGIGDNPWRRIVDARLLPLLMAGRAQKANRAALWLVAVGWLIAVLALADPTWERRPQPVYQTSDARVVVLDLSRSMDASDLKPSRLVRARYKVEDVLALGTEGQTGLVVYAGDAFTVSPLTRDANTIRSLLGVLDPGIMPIDGGRADLGLLKAGELLRQAGASSGQVLLIADGVEADKVGASERAAARLRSKGYRVSVLGVATEDGAPLTNARGAPLRDAGGKVLVSRLDATALQAVARAGGGKYRSITDSGAGLRALLSEDRPLRAEVTTRTDATTQGWKEQGPLLALLLLPLAALAFRRNWLLSVVLLAGLVSPPQPAMASTWDDLWRRPDQQAAKALDAGDYAKAAALATDADRRGSAEYKRGNYQVALDNFAHATGADAEYNRGNALARLGRYQEAIAAYDKSLKEHPGDEDARANKAAVEALLKRQQQLQQLQQQNSQSQGQGDKSQQNQSGNSGGGQNSSHRKPPNQQSQEGKSGQAGASSGQGRQSGEAKQPEGGSQTGEPSRANGNEKPSQDAAAGKGADQQKAAGEGAAQQKKPENQFAEAAKRLAEHSPGEKVDEGPPANEAQGGKAADRALATANAKQHPGGSADSGQPLDSEERLAAEQWLRRIPDDPGGLLRRKFLYQYQQRAQQSAGENL